MKLTSFNDNIIHLCSEFSHRFTLKLNKKFARHGLKVTPEQFSILAILWYKQGISQKEIGEILKRDKTTVARVIMNMKKNGLIKQLTDAADNRSRLIYLTEKAEALQKEAIKISRELYSESLKGTDNETIETGVKLLHQMITNI